MIKFAEKPITTQISESESEFIPHAVSTQETLKKFGVELSNGLSKTEADQRLLRDGINRIEQKKQITVWRIVRDQFSSIVVWLLAFAAAVAWLTGNDLEAIAILVVLVLNAVIGFTIEWQAGRSLEALRKATKTTARVRRDGHEHINDINNMIATTQTKYLIILAVNVCSFNHSFINSR